MNLGILEGMEAHGASGGMALMEILPGRHKDELPLTCFFPTLPQHFCCLVFILIYLLLLTVVSYCFLSQAPKLEELHYPGKLRQFATAHFPGPYLGIKTK